MAIQNIDLGTIPLNGKDGDNAREAFSKVNLNFQDLDTRKVEVVAGKQLSTNDYTNADKAIVNGVQSGLNGRQPLNAKLTAIAESVAAANRLMYFTGTNSVGYIDFPADSRTFLSQATPALKRTTLGLGTSSVLNADAFAQTFLNASTQAAQQSALGLVPVTGTTDFTPGRIPIVGFAGWGADSVIAPADINVATGNQLFRGSPSNNNPYGGTGATGINLQESNAYGWQIIGPNAAALADPIKWRTRTGDNVWGAWRDIWDTGNLTPNKLEDRTQATLGSASSQKGQMFICTNTTTRGQRPVYSDGTNWRRLEDDSLITAA